MARRLPAFSAVAVLALVGVAAAAGSASSDSGGVVRAGSFGTVPPPARDPAVTVTASASDETVASPRPVATVPDPGTLLGFDAEAFDAAIADRLLADGAFAVSIAVAKDGRLIHAGAYGVANPSTGESVEPTDRFRIASNSKVVTATVVLQLVAAGELSLEDEVMPRLAAQFSVELGDSRMYDVTVRQLLNHTSGFQDFQAEFFREQAVGCEDVTVEAMKGRLGSTPGRIVNYSNLNFCLLGLLIEQVTGDGYQQAVQDRLLTPLGITTMRVTGNDDQRDGEVVHPGGTDRNFMEVLGGAGAWVATAADMVVFLDSLDTNREGWHPLPAELAAEMRAPGEHAGANPSHWFGLGLRVWSDGSWGHTGTIQNAHSMILHQPDGYTWAVLVSGSVPSDSDNLRQYVERAFRAIDAPAGPVGPFIFELPTTTTTLPPTTTSAASTTTRSPTTTAPRRPATSSTAAAPTTSGEPATSAEPPVPSPPDPSLPVTEAPAPTTVPAPGESAPPATG